MNPAQTIHAQPPTLIALLLFTLISLGLGVVANLAQRKGTFLEKYFLGGRSLGAFAVALTAAVMSGGTFVGFPSLVYSFGWVVALWIASYMVAPVTVLGILGKRIGQLSRKTGAITLPDLFRERFGSPTLGLMTSLLVMFFLVCNLVAQFAAGARIMKIVLPVETTSWFVGAEVAATTDAGYYIGLAIFTATVVAYTTYGGFLAAIWTDVFQSIIMAIGVMLLFPLAMTASGGFAQATYSGMAQTDPGFGFGPGAGREFHPLGLAISFFFMWAITGMGQPSTLVRLMAFRDSRTLRYSIIYLTIYNALIYIPLLFIFVAARSILPNLASSDDVMPSLVIKLANPYVAGLILAAPYGAVLSTVSGWLLIVSSGLVRDLYQRFFRPTATEREIAWASYSTTVGIGLLVAVVALNPPKYLQLIIVFSSTGMAAAFLMPALLGSFWRRSTAAGAIAAMATGTAVTLGLYVLGTLGPERLHLGWLFAPNPDIGAASSFRPYYLLGFDPCIWGLSASLAAGLIGSWLSPLPPEDRVALLFDAQPADAPAPATLDLHPETKVSTA
ncbi:sodium/pantothenate symporter [Singulisphaera acidiphila]|uniref:Na+/panthothenate symporter n=1 Tax=Singulisphaera acidiphila (strain ATCC BAA-1392 / DSM 18658 / VKM B-2454 / MOB10) TaxID=886293 RepID=L0DL35_SINAD|nr:sodium transporter [Singulisphaera acidiphila]AGA30109.1 Na+/panthothenate symporter [Singulisphaera acidiphila DSM 18658]